MEGETSESIQIPLRKRKALQSSDEKSLSNNFSSPGKSFDKAPPAVDFGSRVSSREVEERRCPRSSQDKSVSRERGVFCHLYLCFSVLSQPASQAGSQHLASEPTRTRRRWSVSRFCRGFNAHRKSSSLFFGADSGGSAAERIVHSLPQHMIAVRSRDYPCETLLSR